MRTFFSPTAHAHFFLPDGFGQALEIQLSVASNHDQHGLPLRSQRHQRFVHLVMRQPHKIGHAACRVNLGRKGEDLVGDFARLQGADGVGFFLGHRPLVQCLNGSCT